MANSKINKYKILELINKLPYNERQNAMKNWHKEIGVAPSTFNRWLYIKTDQGTMIPSDHLIIIAHLLKVSILNLYENPPIKREIESE